jgi:predicted alpha-1,2-mannosidase
MKKIFNYGVLVFMAYTLTSCNTKENTIDYVDCFIGTGGDANLLPVASVPFGLVQMGPDMYLNRSGYKYGGSDKIIGFSHTHMTGGGCNDYKDIMFFPLNQTGLLNSEDFPAQVEGAFSHEQEVAQPGFYGVKLLDSDIDVELTATQRCGMHQYTYPGGAMQQLVIDLKHGHNAGCSVCPIYDYDTVRVSYIEMVDEKTIKGYRISDGFLKGVNVHFYAEFSKPIKNYKIFKDKEAADGITRLEGRDVRMLLEFENTDDKPLVARVGVSPVDTEGARQNLRAEIDTWQFETVKEQAQQSWENALGAIEIEDENRANKEMFYTLQYHSLFYPQIYSDVDGRFRSSDNEVHQNNFDYYGGALSLWDVFRAQLPLVTLLRPDVSNDLMKTFLEHYNNFGQLPNWSGAGVETWCMIGLPAHSVIADIYSKGIQDYDIEALYDAMKVSANVDTFGYSEGNCLYKGTWLYKEYDGYIPCGLDINAAAKSLEFNYSDWSLAQVAKMLHKEDDYNFYIKRAAGYKKLYDNSTKLLRPKHADGSWRDPFDPVLTTHYHEGDDYLEGTAYQWTFFVPHDAKGLAQLMGGDDAFVEQLDSLFIRESVIHHGGKGSPDLNPKGMIGQYAHCNEPNQHVIYMYNTVGQPWKTQKWIDYVRTSLYKHAPDGLYGNDDLGQMSAWYVFSAMGFYPVTHGQGLYYIGTPMFKNLKLKHTNGELTIIANNVSDENIYIQSLTLNGDPYTKNYLEHDAIFNNDGVLVFEMGNQPNKQWGSSDDARPPSMIDEKF